MKTVQDTTMLTGDGSLLWSIIFGEGAQTLAFYFEAMVMGDGPNRFDPSEFVLWGQNEGAYGWCETQVNGASDNGSEDCFGLGIDLYGVRVPEPATIALLGLGLMGFGAARRKRRAHA